MGRALELVRVSGAFGETKAFLTDANDLTRLARWPVAVVLSEIYEIKGEPDLISDLKFPDRKILANAYDGIRRNDEEIERLWSAIKMYEVRRRWEVEPLPGFRDPGKVQLCSTLYPTAPLFSSLEGKKIWKLQQSRERDRRLSKAVKELNRSINNGILVCQGCSFSHEKGALFDAHHLDPLACGVRNSRVDDFALLCPTCHRWSHVHGASPLQPLAIALLKEARQLQLAER